MGLCFALYFIAGCWFSMVVLECMVLQFPSFTFDRLTRVWFVVFEVVSGLGWLCCGWVCWGLV